MGVTQDIAKEVVRTKFEDIPPKAVERIRRGILDDIGIVFMAYKINGKPLVEYAKETGGGLPESTIIGDGSKVSCMAAAGIHAQMAFETDFNETGPGGHALSNIAQTGVAMAERAGASGKDLITAVAVAYEINTRFHRSAFPLEIITGNEPKRDPSFPGSSRHHITNATITAGKLMGLNETQLHDAIGISWYFLSQFSQPILSPLLTFRRMSVFNLGYAHLGIQAAILGQKGYEGPIDLIDLEPHYDHDRLLKSPSPYHNTSTELHLKPWISSRGVQPGISAAVDIVKEEGIKVEDIEEIRYFAKSLYYDFPFDNPEPKEYWHAVYSVQWPFAMALLGVQAGPEWFTEERFNDPKAIALAKKVKIGELPEATAIWNSRVRYTNVAPNEVEVVANGKVYKKRRNYGETPGSSLNPMPIEVLERKFHANAAPVIGEKQSAELFGMLNRLEERKDVREFTELYGPR